MKGVQSGQREEGTDIATTSPSPAGAGSGRAASPGTRQRLPWGLVAAFCTVAVLIAVAGYLAWLSQKESVTKQADKALRAVAKLKADEAYDWLNERTADARTIAGDPLLATAAAQLDDGTATALTRAQVLRRLQSTQAAYAYASVSLLSPDGTVLAAWPAPAQEAAGRYRAIALRAVSSGEVQVSDLFLDEAGEPALYIAAPLARVPASPGRPGAAVIHVDPTNYLYPFIQDWPLPNSTGETLLVERRGDAVLFLNDLRYRDGTALRMTLPLDRQDLPAAKAALGVTGTMAGVDYRGVTVHAAFRPVRGTRWAVVAKLDRQEVLGPLTTRALATAGFTVLLVVLAGAVTLFLWRSRELRSAAELAASRGQFVSLFESMTEGVMLAELVRDSSGEPSDYRILDVNPGYCRITGRTAEQARGTLAGDEGGSLAPAQLPLFADAVRSARPAHIELHAASLDKDLQAEVVPQGGDAFAAVFTDVTERRRAEADLRASEENYRTLIENLSAGIVVHAADTRILLWNRKAEELLRMTGEQLAGKTAVDPAWHFVDADGVTMAPADYPVARVMASGEPLTGLVVGAVPDDTADPMWAICNGYPVLDHRGGLAQVVISFVDVTELEKAREEIQTLNVQLEQRVRDRTAALAASNQELEAFAYSVSHDLRAPLRHIAGFSELLTARLDEQLDDKSRHYLDVISRSVHGMGVLIDDLLLFSRTGRVDLQLQEVDMARLIAEVRDQLTEETVGRDIDWRVAALPRVTGDRTLLRQVWANLLGNAVKYTRASEHAVVEVGHEVAPAGDGGAQDVFFVRDNGVGFDMQYAHKLYGVFQRLHAGTEYEGTGIGLANVKRIVTRLGGSVWAEGGIGEGATFWFSLPRRKGTGGDGSSS